MYQKFYKRLFDSIIALLIIVATTPIWIITAILIYVAMGKPIFFKQERPGLNGKIFTLYKFRTMRDSFTKSGEPLPDGERLTSLGKLIRKTSVDELPQLINILKGDMSLIGPRPLLVEYLSLYSAEQAERHNVRPGISGWAQVNGRNAISWEDKFKLDVEYVQNIGMKLDIKIFFLTIKNILTSTGISAEGEATMQKFKGN